MQDYEKLKGKFTQRWLSRSDEYYTPIFVRLFYAQFYFLQKNPPMTDDMLHHLMKGATIAEMLLHGCKFSVQTTPIQNVFANFNQI